MYARRESKAGMHSALALKATLSYAIKQPRDQKKPIRFIYSRNCSAVHLRQTFPLSSSSSDPYTPSLL